MRTPPFLQTGAIAGFSAPARKITEVELAPALKTIRSFGLKPIVDQMLFAASDQFAGDDAHRAQLLQRLLDEPEVKVVFFVRGGYGSLRIIDQLDFTAFSKNPKWLVGYSDITVLHARLQQLGFESLHATMPINFGENTPDAISSLLMTLKGIAPAYQFNSHPLNRQGEVVAEVVGGNLSTLFSLLGSETFPETAGKILFLEDLDEYLYHIDRMMMAIKRAGKLSHLAGLIVGGMTKMNDNTVPFGLSANEIIAQHVESFDFPICFDFPAGHFTDNRALILGRKSHLRISDEKVAFEQ